MTSNTLKIIACLSMACDHIGFLLFPELTVLRWFGRLALPIFAYFIAEGCLHTRSKTRYFLQVFVMAMACQLFYVGESLLNGGVQSIYLNILFTFSLSILVCWAYLKTINGKKARLPMHIGLFVAALCLAVFCCYDLSKVAGIPVTVDYGIVGILLPVTALFSKNKRINFLCFCAGTVIYCITKSADFPYIWFSLLALPLLALYNGKRGSAKLKWAFYFFYPAHFAIIYGIGLLL